MKDYKMYFNKNLSEINFSPKNPFSGVEYRPELDTSDECIEDQVNFFQNLIEILHLIIELGGIYIAFEVS